MTQEEKQLLLKDLCSRLPHKVIVEFVSYKGEEKPWTGELSCKDLDCFIHDVGFVEIKPYLFPLSSMTEEQRCEYHNNCDVGLTEWGNELYYDCAESLDWLNAHHFDYRGLIEKGLALEATEGMYNN